MIQPIVRSIIRPYPDVRSIVAGASVTPPVVTYATLNPADAGPDIVVSGGNLIASKVSTSWNLVRATLGKSSGKPEFEVTVSVNAARNMVIGVSTLAEPNTFYLGSTAAGCGYYSMSGGKSFAGSIVPFGSAYTTATLTFSYSAAAQTVIVKMNGVIQGILDVSTMSAGALFPTISLYDNGDSASFNAGQTPLLFSEPGYDGRWAA